MALFEYVTVAVSIVLSFGVVRLLDGLRPAVSPQRFYWVHFLWVATKLFNHALYWWGLWALQDSRSWNFASFFWILLFPGALYLQSTALVTTTPAAVLSWRDHFFEIRAWFFGINLLLILHTLVSSAVLLDVPLFALSRIPLGLMLVLNVLGALSASPRLHGAIATVAFVTQVLGFGAILFRPGALATSS